MTTLQDYISRDKVHFYGARGSDIESVFVTVPEGINEADVRQFLNDNPGVCIDGEVLDENSIKITSISGKTKNYDQTRILAELFIPASVSHYMRGLIVDVDFTPAVVNAD